MPVPAALARARFPDAVLHVLRTLDAAGHRSWLVGGAVRDLLIHRRREGTDHDVATPATPAQVTALFPKVIPTGFEHGTVTVLAGGEAIEVTTFRGEGRYVDGRRPESVTFLTELEADLARRDFTMNALAYDPIGGEFRDPFGGRADLRRGVVRAVGDPAERFGEDGLRALRAVRFAAQLGYTLHVGTRAAIPGAIEIVRKVSLERVADELTKLVVSSHAHRGLALMRRTGLLGAVLPALAARPAAELDHVTSILRRAPPAPELRLAALLHTLPQEEVAPLLLRLRLSRRLSEEAGALVRAHACRLGRREGVLPSTPAEVRRWLSRAGPERADALLALASAEIAGIVPSRRRRARAELKAVEALVSSVRAESPPLTTGALALDGGAVLRVLGAGPGPHVGAALRHLLERVLDDPDQNAPDRLEAELRRWWAARGPSL
jgi:tRNA nucleotidyltransferase (CCA-adding enzyme)